MIAEEAGAFTIDDVAADIIEKMAAATRTSSATPADGPRDADEVNELWEAIKAAEKQRDSVIDGHPADAARAAVRRQGARPARAAGAAAAVGPTRRPTTSATGCWPSSPRPARPASTPSRRCATPYAACS